MGIQTVNLTTTSGRDVYFCKKSGTSVYVGNSGETLRVTKNVGESIRVTNPEALSGELRKMWDQVSS